MSKTVDVIVVFSSESIVLIDACLQSIQRETLRQFNLIVVNNGGGVATTKFLDKFITRHPYYRLLRNTEMCGYPPAANKGLQVSTADYCVLLNGDTVVTRGWLGKMVECAESSPRIGIVGPFSNAASWQSIPWWVDAKGRWSTNPLPLQYAPNDIARIVDDVSLNEFPRIPFINGFCFLIKREVIDTIGYFDDETFAAGYGEEDDYCLRAADAGFIMAVADRAYVFHAKTQAYGSERRSRLCEGAGAKLTTKYGDRVKDNVALIQANRSLERCRKRVVDAFRERGFATVTVR